MNECNSNFLVYSTELCCTRFWTIAHERKVCCERTSVEYQAAIVYVFKLIILVTKHHLCVKVHSAFNKLMLLLPRGEEDTLTKRGPNSNKQVAQLMGVGTSVLDPELSSRAAEQVVCFNTTPKHFLKKGLT